jgi:transcriptional regulator with XRE-family HTH domain
MSLKQIFITNLKNYRKEKGVSQMKLAELCDSATSYIGQIEIGNKFPSVDMVEKIAAALQIRPYQLFYEASSPAAAEPLLPPPPLQAPLIPAMTQSAAIVLPEPYKAALIRDITAAVTRIVRRR